MTFARWWIENNGILWKLGGVSPTVIKELFEACWHDGYKVRDLQLKNTQRRDRERA